MFEVTVMTDDKKLPKLLWALEGHIVGQPKITLVRGAKAKGGRVVADNNTTIPDQVAALIRERNLERVNTAQIRNMVKELGGKTSIYGHVTYQLRHRLKVLGKGKRGQGYAVLTAKE